MEEKLPYLLITHYYFRKTPSFPEVHRPRILARMIDEQRAPVVPICVTYMIKQVFSGPFIKL